MSIHWAWKNTEGKTGALFLLLGVVPVVVGALTHFISLLGLFFIDMILGYVVMVYFVAVLSVAYELIAGENKHDDSEPKDDMTIEL
ncbi:hypothetical protein [Enterovibrio coralii]|uniref:hypothetical protein n=1 Tax=Enterovibrio coralii TaxID=294935 RepID=UPI000A772E9E|nr:hypothetical protein [Enterovibrio coralii]